MMYLVFAYQHFSSQLKEKQHPVVVDSTTGCCGVNAHRCRCCLSLGQKEQRLPSSPAEGYLSAPASVISDT